MVKEYIPNRQRTPGSLPLYADLICNSVMILRQTGKILCNVVVSFSAIAGGVPVGRSAKAE